MTQPLSIPVPATLAVADIDFEIDAEVSYVDGPDGPEVEGLTLNGSPVRLEPEQEASLTEQLRELLPSTTEETSDYE
jgi:hypothetical protein